MAKNDFKAFATDRNANVISQEEWEALPVLLSGFTAGKASSAQVNKVIRQASFIAAALAQFVSDKTQRDVLDNGDLPGFVELLGSGFAVEYLSRKNPFGDIKSDGTVKTALENLGFGEGANWVMLPGGMIIQRVYLGFPVGTNVRHITFPRSFTTTNYSISINWNDIGTATTETQSPANVAVVHQTKSLTGASIWQAGPGGFNVDIIAVGY
ncbi:hypothetical protein ACRW4G_08705 [Escherichia coli]|uniref:hypothetical protein n=3 Tax=Enterobacteriaceae TaxID=543 RepID=UPI000DEF13CF|nr:hypothetical protein [Escherichia coli]EJI8261142.1 hypothetical protein [Shigella sonnei]EEC9222408.1 hypothetical protein [Escherichia coli]EEQ4304571.1 hypothetical protein [Escherichia coli]EEQ7622935.1 hypothetical protein [Escherichia coli]EES2283058.1 hypothetical protein [Escherichia coli]